MTLDEIIKDLQKLRDEKMKGWEKMSDPTNASLIALAQADGMTTAIAKLIEFRNKERQEQQQ
jgi:hypothetical protein